MTSRLVAAAALAIALATSTQAAAPPQPEADNTPPRILADVLLCTGTAAVSIPGELEGASDIRFRTVVVVSTLHTRLLLNGTMFRLGQAAPTVYEFDRAPLMDADGRVTGTLDLSNGALVYRYETHHDEVPIVTAVVAFCRPYREQ
jgi:hypothetical protein